MSTPPLDGNEIGVFAWYAHGLPFTDGEYANLHAQLSDKTSKSPDEYYDGTYVYNSATPGSVENTYTVRIRKDGYILAWMQNTREAVYDFDFTGNSPLSQRAMQAIMSAAGVSGFDFIKCYYYNCNYPDATKVRWFGMNNYPYSTRGSSYYYYLTIPAALEIFYAKIYGWCPTPSGFGGNAGNNSYIQIDGATYYANSSGITDVLGLSKDIEHAIRHYSSSIGGKSYNPIQSRFVYYCVT